MGWCSTRASITCFFSTIRWAFPGETWPGGTPSGRTCSIGSNWKTPSFPTASARSSPGSAVIDRENTAGFQTGREKPIVCIYTSAGKPFTQSIAYSNDRGRTWTKYAQNPVLKHVAGDNRDPKVFWHEPGRKWIMALFLDGNSYALFGSPNLKDWTRLCDVPVPGGGECPDFFPLPVDGDRKNVKWVFWAANNSYLLGSFDGTTFKREAGPLTGHWGKNRYAAQTFSDIPGP